MHWLGDRFLPLTPSSAIALLESMWLLQRGSYLGEKGDPLLKTELAPTAACHVAQSLRQMFGQLKKVN